MLERFFKAKSFGLHISKPKKIPGNIFVDISKVRKSSRRGLLGRQNCILSQKSVPQGPFGRIQSADLRFGVLDPLVGEARGEVYLPPTPLRPGAGHRRGPRNLDNVGLKGANPRKGPLKEKNDCGAKLQCFF